MAERTLVDYLFRGMQPYWVHPVKHADAFTLGIADVSAWLHGPGNIWIETKAKDSWPKRPSTLVAIEKNEDRWALQKEFLTKRRGWLFVRMERDYLLFHWTSLSGINVSNRAELLCIAHAWWDRQVDWQEFSECLKRN